MRLHLSITLQLLRSNSIGENNKILEMKTVLVIVSALSIGQLAYAALDIPEHLRAPLKHVRRACIQQSNVDEKHILATRDGFIPDVPELKCYILCLFEHGGIINDDDSIDFTIVYHLMTPDHRKTIEYVSETCGTKRGSTRCETAWLTLKCFYELAPEGAELP